MPQLAGPAGLRGLPRRRRRTSQRTFALFKAEVPAGGRLRQTFTVAQRMASRKALDEVLHFVKRMVAGGKQEDTKQDLCRLEDE